MILIYLIYVSWKMSLPFSTFPSYYDIKIKKKKIYNAISESQLHVIQKI